MTQLSEKIISSVREIKNKILQLESEISKLENLNAQHTDSFEKVSTEINNLEEVERLIGQVEGLRTAIGILKFNFSSDQKRIDFS